MQALGTILGVWAHPDDETYLTAGLMAAAVRGGRRVVCVTATRGEEGSWDEDRWPTESLGMVREKELEASLRILGVTEHHWLDHHDGTLADVPLEDGAGRIAGFIEEVRPDSVFTFGPEGMTDHPDHKAVHAWTTEAFRRAAPAGATLYYAAVTQEWSDRWKPLLDRFNVFYSPDTPPVRAHGDLAILWELPPDLLDLKYEAIQAHVSQMEGFNKAFGPDFLRDSNATEAFYVAERKAR